MPAPPPSPRRSGPRGEGPDQEQHGALPERRAEAASACVGTTSGSPGRAGPRAGRRRAAAAARPGRPPRPRGWQARNSSSAGPRQSPSAARPLQDRVSGGGTGRRQVPAAAGGVEVELVGLESQPVAARRDALQPFRLDAEVAAKPGHVVVQRLHGVLRRVVGPERVDEPLDPDHAAGGKGQHGEQRAATAPGTGTAPRRATRRTSGAERRPRSSAERGPVGGSSSGSWRRGALDCASACPAGSAPSSPRAASRAGEAKDSVATHAANRSRPTAATRPAVWDGWRQQRLDLAVQAASGEGQPESELLVGADPRPAERRRCSNSSLSSGSIELAPGGTACRSRGRRRELDRVRASVDPAADGRWSDVPGEAVGAEGDHRVRARPRRGARRAGHRRARGRARHRPPSGRSSQRCSVDTEDARAPPRARRVRTPAKAARRAASACWVGRLAAGGRHADHPAARRRAGPH